MFRGKKTYQALGAYVKYVLGQQPPKHIWASLGARGVFILWHPCHFVKSSPLSVLTDFAIQFVSVLMVFCKKCTGTPVHVMSAPEEYCVVVIDNIAFVTFIHCANDGVKTLLQLHLVSM